MMTLCATPPELWICIINELGSTKNASAYELPSDSRHALSQLCLVNTAMKCLAEPVLYTRIRINPTTLKHFSHLIGVDEAVIEHAEVEGGYLATQKARMIKSLAIDKFGDRPVEPEDLLQLASILRAVRSTVSRLFIDVLNYPSDFGEADDPAVSAFQEWKAALFELSNIEEYCFAPRPPFNNLELRPKASSSKIKRLVMLYTPLNELANTVGSLPSLEFLIVSFAGQHTVIEEDPFTFLEAGGVLKRVVVVIHSPTFPPQTEPLRAWMRRGVCKERGFIIEMPFQTSMKEIGEGKIWDHSDHAFPTRPFSL
ncbi:hypothetical protein FRB94_010509 [Tulasnella sp. JGI-2019a]|nr:hypothetical protein FRB93_008390 [Tulasnella sp. JGI-2019a]KAG8993641.1 hypothetical protein FRB94_010509 [Tulasnella sp. JGI-2019a]KAG9027987.1 hypothetical protein FRB95_006993 [Tulasnella sp. JGI-2019a]